MEEEAAGTELGVQPISEDALRQFDSLAEAQRISDYEERLAADQALVWRLQWAGYDGPDWQELAAALVGYGVQVIRAWIISGRIFSECRLKGLGGELMKNQEPQWWANDPYELAWDTNSEAVRGFRDNVLLKKRWTSTKGASLKTFYIGQTLIQFVTVYRRWLRERRMVASGLAEDYASTLLEAGPEEAVGLRLLVREEMALITDQTTRQVITLTAAGYKQDEIAEILSLDSTRAVEGLLHRQRKRRRERREA